MDKEKYLKLPVNTGRFFFTQRYFWEKWLEQPKRRRVFKSLSKKRPQQEITMTTYNRIVKRYLQIYFYELLFLDRASYFFIGGKAVRCRISKFVTFDSININESVSFVWYRRPLYMYLGRMRVYFMRGKTSSMVAIKKELLQTINLNTLPLAKDLLEEFDQKNILVTEKQLEP